MINDIIAVIIGNVLFFWAVGAMRATKVKNRG